MDRRSRRAAFTLVELLVVIGIIALLISILLPSLNRAREAGRKTQCLSNLRQLGMAFNMYFNENKGKFPRSAPYQNGGGRTHRDEDWIYWQRTNSATGALLDVKQSAILRLIKRGDVANVCRCPSDTEYKRRPLQKDTDGSRYEYSYTMNNRMAFMFESFMPKDSANNPLPYATTITKVKRAADKVLLYEEDEITLDDGAANPRNGANLLAIRHDHRRRYPDTVSGGIVPNPDCRGNVLFCDSHADFIPRSQLHDTDSKRNLTGFDRATDPSK